MIVMRNKFKVSLKMFHIFRIIKIRTLEDKSDSAVDKALRQSEYDP